MHDHQKTESRRKKTKPRTNNSDSAFDSGMEDKECPDAAQLTVWWSSTTMTMPTETNSN
jgi:hypothetical protein